MNRCTSLFSIIYGIVLGGCLQRPAPYDHAFSINNIGPRDFAIGVTADDGVFFGWLAGETDQTLAADANAYFVEHMQVYSIESGQPVAGEIRPGFWSMNGDQLTEPVFMMWLQEGTSFIPTEPLAEGWYIAALDMGPWRAAGHSLNVIPWLVDDVAYLRFHVGPSPVWYDTYVDSDDPLDPTGPHHIGPILGVPDVDVRGLTRNPFSLLVNGSVDPRCSEVRDPDYGDWFWRCPALPPETEFTVRLDDDSVVLPLSGIRTQTFPLDPNLRRDGLMIDPRLGIDIARGAP